MNRRVFIKTGSLLLLASMSSLFASDIKDQKYFNTVILYDKIQKEYLKSIKKVENAGYYLNKNNIGFKHNLTWFFGPDINISESEFKLKLFNKESTLISGFGLNNSLEITFKKIFKPKYNVELKSKELSFLGFRDLFNSVYDRLTQSSKIEFLDLFYHLEEANIVDTKILEQEFKKQILFETLMEPYIFIEGKDTDFYIYLDNNKVLLTREDTYIYYLTLFICNEILLKAKSRVELYAI